MFEDVLPKNATKQIDRISPRIKDFYLAGGTGLALQLRHRKSYDLDFFSQKVFNAYALLKRLNPDRTNQVSDGTIHCEYDKTRFSFLYFGARLVYTSLSWRRIKIADWRDITAEKFRTIADRGNKKDFYDLYAILQLRLTVKEACTVFKRRFGSSDINMYHVLKSLTFFEDAEEDPTPMLLVKDEEWEWQYVKRYFEKNIRQFEEFLLR